MDLAEIITQAIAANRALIDATGKKWPDRPVELTFSWMPQMGKVDVVIKSIDHLPSWRLPKTVKVADLALGSSAE